MNLVWLPNLTYLVLAGGGVNQVSLLQQIIPSKNVRIGFHLQIVTSPLTFPWDHLREVLSKKFAHKESFVQPNSISVHADSKLTCLIISLGTATNDTAPTSRESLRGLGTSKRVVVNISGEMPFNDTCRSLSDILFDIFPLSTMEYYRLPCRPDWYKPIRGIDHTPCVVKIPGICNQLFHLNMKNLRVLYIQYSAIEYPLLRFLCGMWEECGSKNTSTPTLKIVPFPALEVLIIEMCHCSPCDYQDSRNCRIPVLRKIVQSCKDIQIPLTRIRFSGLSTEDRNGLDCKVEGVDVDFI